MSIRALLRRFREQPRGQSFVEFALILPVFLVILSAAVDLGRIAYARVTIANVAREASFQAAQTPGSYQAGLPCTSGDEESNLVICRAILESKGSVVTVTPADITMACSPSCDSAMGNTVTVTARGRFNLLTPVMSLFFGGTRITFTSSSTNQIAALPPSTAVLLPTDDPSPGDIAVPDLYSKTEAQALDLLTAAGLTAGTRAEDYDPVVPLGSVIDQGPVAGTLVAAGTAVSYIVSRGPQAGCDIVSAGFGHTVSPEPPEPPTSPVTVSVTDTTTYNHTCVTVWAWDWGDGTVTFGQNPGPHVYYNRTGPAGNTKTFNLTLTVTSGTFTDTSGTVEITVIK